MTLSVQITCRWSTTDGAQKLDTGFITTSVLQTRSVCGIILENTSILLLSGCGRGNGGGDAVMHGPGGMDEAVAQDLRRM